MLKPDKHEWNNVSWPQEKTREPENPRIEEPQQDLEEFEVGGEG